MANTPEDRDRRLDEAIDWFEQTREGTVDRKAFDQWMRDPLNIEAWIEVRESDDAIEPLRAARALLKELDAQNITGMPANDLEGPSVGEKSGRTVESGWLHPDRRKMLYWLTGAAGVSAVGLVGYMANARERAQTKVGEQRIINLPDGAILDLNTDTKASWKMNASTRDIWLEQGELALNTSHAAQPFVLRDGPTPLVAVSNGELNVRRTGRGLDVTVVQGGALIQKASGLAPELASGMALVTIGGKSQVQTIGSGPAARSVLWRQRQLHFDGETLAQAVAEYNRYLPNKILIEDPSLNSIRILATGNWRIDAPEEFLNSLSSSFDVSVKRKTEGGYLLQKRAGGAE